MLMDVLLKVCLYTQGSWPNNDVDLELKLYATWRYELTVEAGCLLWGMRVVILDCYQKDVLVNCTQAIPFWHGEDEKLSLCSCLLARNWQSYWTVGQRMWNMSQMWGTILHQQWYICGHGSWPDAPWKRPHVVDLLDHFKNPCSWSL